MRITRKFFIYNGFLHWWLWCFSVVLLAGLLVGDAEEAYAARAGGRGSRSSPSERRLERVSRTGERRIALVIGNNNYAHARKLDNAVADATVFRKELEDRGFTVVYGTNATRRQMNDAIVDFLGKLSTDAIALVYYAGHGVQVDNDNYLLPIDIVADKEADLVNDGISLSGLLKQISKLDTKFTLAIVDACRDNPFSDTVGRSIGGARGLTPPLGNARGIMVVYSAGADQRALDKLDDNDTNPNGLFTREFIKAMRKPGLSVQLVVNEVKDAVIAQADRAGHEQTPAIYDQSRGKFYFTAPTQHEPATEPKDQSEPVVQQPNDAKGSITVYATGPGKQAMDSADGGSHGLFTQEFLKAMRIPNVTIQEVVKQTIPTVKSISNGKQIPYMVDQSVGKFMLIPAKNSTSEQRVALVIGSANYAFNPLKTPLSDAQAIKNELEALGFQVILLLDATRGDMEAAAEKLMGALSNTQYKIGLVYFAGMGVSINGTNYFIPIDSKIATAPNLGLSELISDSFNFTQFMEKLTEHTNFALAILDTCNDNPFENQR